MNCDEQIRRELILASALLHTSVPGEHVTANCDRVLRHALRAAGLWDEAFVEDFGGGEQNPVVQTWYGSLIELARVQPVGAQLMEGAGDLSTPAGAHFTACWLTPTGEAAARQILQAHPEWETILRTEDVAF